MSIFTYFGIGIALFFGLAAIIYVTMFRNPSYLDDLKVPKNQQGD
mgnify:CR=1 FL=1